MRASRVVTPAPARSSCSSPLAGLRAGALQAAAEGGRGPRRRPTAAPGRGEPDRGRRPPRRARGLPSDRAPRGAGPAPRRRPHQPGHGLPPADVPLHRAAGAARERRPRRARGPPRRRPRRPARLLARRAALRLRPRPRGRRRALGGRDDDGRGPARPRRPAQRRPRSRHRLEGGREAPRPRGPARPRERPAAPTVPVGPLVEETAGKASQMATFQDLLRTPHDEAVFEHFARGQLLVVDPVSGQATALGSPGLVADVDPSPDGRYLLVHQRKRPFSTRVPFSYFARTRRGVGRGGEAGGHDRGPAGLGRDPAPGRAHGPSRRRLAAAGAGDARLARGPRRRRPDEEGRRTASAS